MEKVKISDFDHHGSNFVVGDYKYAVTDLIKLSSKIEPFDMPLIGINLSAAPWGDIDIDRFIYHTKRVNEADSKYPIILDKCGFICDGWHRVVKAIIEGKETIRAVRLEVMPDCL